MCHRERFTSYKSLSKLVLYYKRIGPPCCTLFTFVTCCSLQIILSQNYLLPLISVLAENTFLETAYHFLLLLVRFDTLTYQKDYDGSPTLVGHQYLDVVHEFWEEAIKGVPLSIASEPSESSDKDCSAWDLAGLQKRCDSMR